MLHNADEIVRSSFAFRSELDPAGDRAISRAREHRSGPERDERARHLRRRPDRDRGRTRRHHARAVPAVRAPEPVGSRRRARDGHLHGERELSLLQRAVLVRVACPTSAGRRPLRGRRASGRSRPLAIRLGRSDPALHDGDRDHSPPDLLRADRRPGRAGDCLRPDTRLDPAEASWRSRCSRPCRRRLGSSWSPAAPSAISRPSSPVRSARRSIRSQGRRRHDTCSAARERRSSSTLSGSARSWCWPSDCRLGCGLPGGAIGAIPSCACSRWRQWCSSGFCCSGSPRGHGRRRTDRRSSSSSASPSSWR